jgi:1-acyl-sn-glycerol-3-phosphate acyltransferase
LADEIKMQPQRRRDAETDAEKTEFIAIESHVFSASSSASPRLCGCISRPWHKTTPPIWIAPWFDLAGRIFFKIAFFTSLRVGVLRRHAEPPGGYVLACTHLSHLEPLCASVLTRRKIDWMARIEFFRWKPAALCLRWLDALSVNRTGVPVMALRTAVERARRGRIVGVFPEGGVAKGRDAVFRGGPIKRGACLVACQAQVPIVPCVLLGTEKLNCVRPWLPIKQGKLWVAFGQPIAPRPYPPGRAAASLRRQQRAAMAQELQREFMDLYQQLREKYGIEDSAIP